MTIVGPGTDEELSASRIANACDDLGRSTNGAAFDAAFDDKGKDLLGTGFDFGSATLDGGGPFGSGGLLDGGGPAGSGGFHDGGGPFGSGGLLDPDDEEAA